MPLVKASFCASDDASPVRAMIGVGASFFSCSYALMALVASSPSMTGMEMSINMHLQRPGALL